MKTSLGALGKIVKVFTIADVTLWAGWGLFEPIFSVYIIKQINGATVATAGIAAAIYWLVRSSLQIPISNYLDKTPGENDDFRALIAGLFLSAISAFSFVAINQIWQLYLVQAVHGVAFALYIPSWLAIFSRHLDKNRTSFDWALDNMSVGFGVAATGFIGGVVANIFGFKTLFMGGAVLSLMAAFILLKTPHLILPPRTSRRKFPKKPVIS